MRRLLAWYEAIRRANQARADREILVRLDQHTLRDIGLDSWNPHLAARLEERRRHVVRMAVARIGAS